MMAAARSLRALRDLSACFVEERPGQTLRRRAMRMLVSGEGFEAPDVRPDIAGPRTPFDHFFFARFRR